MTDELAPTRPGLSELAGAAEEVGPGDLIEGRYRLDRRIGAGGMGAVWQARDLHLGRDVAIKRVALVHPLARARFVREGKVAARLNHPGLCKVYDVGELGGVGHLVMELLAGETVYQRLLRTGPERRWRIAIMLEVTRAMAAAHAQGLVHRDLKPDNLFIDRLTGRERIVVIDFGLAFLDGGDDQLGRLTQGDITGGTPQYMAPEQARALTIGAAADVYSLGCVLFELLAGRPPFEGAPAVVMSRQVFAAPPSLVEHAVDVDHDLVSLVDAMLRKAPDARPPMAEVAERLDSWLTRGPRPAPARTSAVEPRVHRMLTRDLQASEATPTGAPTGLVAAFGPIPDEVLVAAATAGLLARRVIDPTTLTEADELPRVVLADVDDEAMAALARLGHPLIGVAPAGDVEAAVHLARLGCADVVTRPVQPEAAVRKLVRQLRRVPARKS